MYAMFANIDPQNHPNVGIYYMAYIGIHAESGYIL